MLRHIRNLFRKNKTADFVSDNKDRLDHLAERLAAIDSRTEIQG